MTAAKNDKVDAKPAMQFVFPSIWDTIRLVKMDPASEEGFKINLMDLINHAKEGKVVLNTILKLIACQYGRVNTLRSIGLAMRAGEIKYGDWNFLSGHGYYQLLGAMERHALSILDDEFLDVDTSDRLGVTVPHYGCIGAGINMILWQRDWDTSRDDGPRLLKEGSTDALYIQSST